MFASDRSEKSVVGDLNGSDRHFVSEGIGLTQPEDGRRSSSTTVLFASITLLVMKQTESIYAGLWGLPLSGEVDFGHGITLRPTYVHVMTHTMLAFARPERPDTHHPAPWKATTGVSGYDVEAELCIPSTYSSHKIAKQDVAKSLVGLLRLYVHPDIRFAVSAAQPFAELANSNELIVAKQREIDPRHFDFGQVSMDGHEQRLEWVKQHWETALHLIEQSPEFRLALDVYLSGQFISNPAMVMVATWGALEALFLDTKAELRFRVSSLLAAYMEPRGKTRSAFQKKAAKLYDKRSAAAHGSAKHELPDLVDSFYVLRDVLIRMIEVGKVPTREELEARLFED